MFCTEYPRYNGLQRYYNGSREIVALFAKYRSVDGKMSGRCFTDFTTRQIFLWQRFEASFSLHVVFDNKVKARTNANVAIKLREKYKRRFCNFFFFLYISVRDGTLSFVQKLEVAGNYYYYNINDGRGLAGPRGRMHI